MWGSALPDMTHVDSWYLYRLSSKGTISNISVYLAFGSSSLTETRKFGNNRRPFLKTKNQYITITKRKWREIESIKDKYRLRNELKDIDQSLDYDLADLDF